MIKNIQSLFIFSQLLLEFGNFNVWLLKYAKLYLWLSKAYNIIKLLYYAF